MNQHVLKFLLVAALGAAPAISAQSESPPEAPMTVHKTAEFLRPGEELVLKLSWGIITAGETRFITTMMDTDEGPRFRVRVVTESRGIVNALYPIKNDSESIIDPATGRPLVVNITGRNGGDNTSATTTYDYEAGKVTHTDHVKPQRGGTAELPEEPIFDVMVTMMRVREWNMQPGDVRSVKASFEDDVYDLEITAVEEETVRTPAGKFEAVMIEVKQLGELKGFFKNGGTMKYWISKGENPQIVRMDMRMNIGTIRGVLRRVGEAVDPGDEAADQSESEA